MKITQLCNTPFHQLAYRSSGPGGKIRNAQLPFLRATVDALPAGMECIVAVSDIQGREADMYRNRLVGEAVAEELAVLQELEVIPEIGLVILAGDLFDYPDCRKLGGTGDVTSAWNAFAKVSPLVVGVHGNHDTIQASALASNAMPLDAETREIGGLRFGGVSGIVGPADRHHRRSEATFKEALRRTLTARTDVLLLHQCPDDPAHGQVGAPLVREFLEKNGEALVIAGHKHWSMPLAIIGTNQVLNVDHRLCVLTTVV